MVNITKWKSQNFSTSQFDSTKFAQFSRELKWYLRFICDSIKAEIVSYEAGNFIVTAIVQRKDGQLVRVTLSDVRRSRNFDFILLSTIPSMQSWNQRTNFVSLENLSSWISNL
jgi:hypothetical protein